MKKNVISAVILCALPLSAISYLFYCLETYYEVVHNDSAALIGFYCIITFIISTEIWRRNRKANRSLTAIWGLSTLVLILVLLIGNRIPFCVECDQVTAEDLGFLIHWIKPINS